MAPVPRPTPGGSPSASAAAPAGGPGRSIGAAVSILGVSKWFRTGRSFLHALDEIDMEIQPGEFVSLIGPSGCGKSTLLRVVGGLLPYELGTVTVDGNTPAQALGDEWSPGNDGPRRVRGLARALASSPAT